MSCENMQDGGKKHLKKLSKKTSKKPSSDKKKKTSLRKVKSGCGCQTHTMTGGGCGCGKQKGGSYNVHYSPFYVAPGTVGANTQSWENNQSGGKKSSKNKISGGSGAVGHTVMPHQYYGAEQPTMSGTGAHITSIDLSGGDAPMARGGIPENFTQSLVGGTKHKSKKSLSKKSDKKKPSKKSKKVSGGMAVENSPQSVMDLKQSDLIGGTKHKKKSSKKSSDKKKSSKKNKSSGGNPFTGRY